ncbi:MAG: PP2C family protein-serine/threonine phosphatase, partial [Chloroflexota bacterium]
MAIVADPPGVVEFPAGSGWQAAAASRTGSRRQVNEDGWLIVPVSTYRPLLLAVADGVGGEAAGERASAEALAALERVWREWTPHGAPSRDEVRGRLLAAAGDADLAVQRLSRDVPQDHGPATTLTAVAAGIDYLALVHAGDSRAYRVRRDAVEQLTADHTWVAEQIAERRLDPANAARHPMRHMITRYLGQPGGCAFAVDVLPRDVDDSLLLCTDGVSNTLAGGELAALVGGPTTDTSLRSDPAPPLLAPPTGSAQAHRRRTAIGGNGTSDLAATAGAAQRVISLVAARDGDDDATVVVAWPASEARADPFGLRRVLGRRTVRRPLLARGAT